MPKRNANVSLWEMARNGVEPLLKEEEKVMIPFLHEISWLKTLDILLYVVLRETQKQVPSELTQSDHADTFRRLWDYGDAPIASYVAVTLRKQNLLHGKKNRQESEFSVISPALTWIELL